MLGRYTILAEEIFHSGLTRRRLEQIGKLKDGKTFADLSKSVKQSLGSGGPYGYWNGIGRITTALEGIVELYPSYIPSQD